MKLAQLLIAAGVIAPQGHPPGFVPSADTADTAIQGKADMADMTITGLFCRSQDVTPGGVFVAIKGFSANGHDFIPQAISQGAVAVIRQQPGRVVNQQPGRVVYQQPGPEDYPQSLVESNQQPMVSPLTLEVPDTRTALADLAAAYYGHPSREMTLIGITGTNGKTTTSYLIESILTAAGAAVGVIGTINYRFAGQSYDNPVTTPESLDLQSILAKMRLAGTTHVVLEVSSHALALQRVRGCEMDVGVFTNLTQDHLDFHQDMEAYWKSKKKLFTQILPAATATKHPLAVINGEDPRGRQLLPALSLPYITTGMSSANQIWAQNPRFSLTGIESRIHTPRGEIDLQSPLTGRHNLENILNAVGVGLALDLPLADIQKGIAGLQWVPGRLERLPNALERNIYVDYAHTPDALENVLQALRDLTQDRLICVFGCGGDRDKTKRPQMGDIVTRLSDIALVTSDNPRTEPPLGIIEDILAGIQTPQNGPLTAEEYLTGHSGYGFLVESDRRSAIGLSIQGSRPGDTILIAGKGHENYQIIGCQKYPFDDREEALKALAQLSLRST